MADTKVGYYYPSEAWNNWGGFFHDIATDGTDLFAIYCGGTPTGAGRESWAVVYKISISTLAISASRKLRAYPQDDSDNYPHTCGQTLAVYGDYVYVYPSLNTGLGTTRACFCRLNKSDLSYASGKYVGTGTGTQCCKIDSDGKAWIGGGNALVGLQLYTHNADFSVLKRATTSDVSMPMGLFIDSSSNNDIYYLGTMNKNDYNSFTVIRFTQSGWSSSNPTVTFSSGFAVGTAQSTPASDWTTSLSSFAMSACSDSDTDYMWVSGTILDVEDPENKRDGLLLYVKKRNASDSNNLQILNAWRFKNAGTDYDFAMGEVFCDSTYVYVTKTVCPHNGLGLDDQVAGKHTSTIMRITKSTLFSSPSTAISWARGVSSSSGSGKSHGIHSVVSSSVLYEAGLSNTVQNGGKPVCFIRKEDLTNTSTSTLYSSDALTKIFDVKSSSVTIEALTISTDLVVASVSSFSLTMGNPATLETWSDTSSTGSNGSSVVTLDSATLITTLRPTADSSKNWGYPDSGTHYDEVSDQSDATYAWHSNITESWKLDSFVLSNPPSEAKVDTRVVKIRVWQRTRSNNYGDGGKAKNYIYIGTTEARSGEHTIAKNSAFTNYYYDWSTNPHTSVAWTWDDIDNLIAGADLFNDNYFGLPQIQCAEIWVDVYYEPVAIGSASGLVEFNISADETIQVNDPAYARHYVKRW